MIQREIKNSQTRISAVSEHLRALRVYKALTVKIDADFEVRSKLIDRKALPRTKGGMLHLDWDDFH